MKVDLTDHYLHRRGPNRSIKLWGSGRIIGIALVGEPYRFSPEPGRFLFAGRAADCSKSGCMPDDVFNYVYGTSSSNGNASVLKAGNYTLYLIADESPTKVILRFTAGSSDSQKLEIPTGTSTDLQTPATRFRHSDDGGTAWWSGDSYSRGSAGLAFSALFVESSNLANTTLQSCQYEVVPPPPDNLAYGPHCYLAAFGAGSGYDIVLTDDFPHDRFVIFLLSAYHDQGTHVPSDEMGLGFYVQSPNQLTDFGVNALTLNIR